MASTSVQRLEREGGGQGRGQGVPSAFSHESLLSNHLLKAKINLLLVQGITGKGGCPYLCHQTFSPQISFTM